MTGLAAVVAEPLGRRAAIGMMAHYRDKRRHVDCQNRSRTRKAKGANKLTITALEATLSRRVHVHFLSNTHYSNLKVIKQALQHRVNGVRRRT